MESLRSTLFTVLLLSAVLVQAPAPLLAQEKDETLELYYSANALYNRKLYTLALEEYGAFLRRHPGHEKTVQARLGTALCHYALGDHKNAEPVFARLAGERGLDNPQEIHNLWGQCLLALERPDEAERAFTWSTTRGDDSAQKTLGMVGLIEAQYRQKKWKDVVEGSDRFLRDGRDPSQVKRVTFQYAVARFELGEFEKARGLLESLSDQEETTAFMQHVFFLLGECLRETGDYQGAAGRYNRAARRMTGAFTAESLYRLGFVRFQNGDFRAAAADFQELIDEHGESENIPSAKLYLGRSLLEIGNTRQAEKVLLSIPAESDEFAASRLWLGRAASKQGDLGQAERSLIRSLRDAKPGPGRADLLYELGGVRMELEEYETAAESFGEAAAENAESSLTRDALWFETYCLHKAGRFDESLERCTSFLSGRPGQERRAEVSFLRAENLFMLDRFPEADRLFNDFVAAFPDHFYSGPARFRIVQTRWHRQQWRSAVEAADGLLQEKPDAAFFDQILYLKGDCHYNLQEWDKAIDSFAGFIREHPGAENTDAAAFKTALAWQSLGDDRKAAAVLEPFEGLYPGSPYLSHAQVELGRLMYESGRYDEARIALLRAADSENGPHALYYLGYLSIAEEDTDGAVASFRTLEKRHPGSELVPDAILQQGVLHIRTGDHEQGRAALKRFLDNHGGHEKAGEASFYLGVALARQEKWKAAAERFREVLDGYPQSRFRDRALYEWAWCEKGQGRSAEAAGCYEEFLRAFPESDLAAHVAFELAELNYESEQYGHAVELLEQLIKRDIDDELRERCIYRLGWNCFSSGQMADAARWFESMLKESPQSPRTPVALYQAGEARLQLKEHEEAYGHYRRLADLGQTGDFAEQALLRLGECAALTQRWQEAEGVYDRFASRYPESAFLNQALFGRGWALENQERYGDAIEAYGRVLARGLSDETTARSQFQIGECYFSMKKYDDAVKALIKVEVMHAFPQWSSKALLETGRALEIPGKIEAAKARYREVIEKYPQSDAAAVARRKLENS